MIAKIRIVVEVPYDYDVGEPDENGNNPKMIEAADHANTVILDETKSQVTGGVIDDECMVEEVRVS
jgi:hypothetical protein